MRTLVPLLTTIAFCICAAAQAEEAEYACYTGAYQLRGGELIVITPSEPGTLRYRMFDGRSGRLYPAKRLRASGATVGLEFESGDDFTERKPVTTRVTFGSCRSGRLALQVRNTPARYAHRIALPMKPVQFSNAGVNLYGELRLPPRNAKPRALVVLIQGSGDDSAVASHYLQYMLPPQGIATLTYDKRGTGRSGGQYSANFPLLADDAVAAVAQARKMIDDPSLPVGLLGESQGGWIAPLAATRAPVDFTVVAYGLAISPIEEDREEVFAELRSRGYGDDIVAKSREVTAATARILLSRFTEGFDDLRRVKAAYAGEKWLEQIEGDYTGPMLKTPESELREKIGALIPLDASADYQPVPVLRNVTSPMMWVLAGKDTEAPMPPTLAVLRELQTGASKLDIAIFPNADHGIIDVQERNGERRLLQYSPGYYQLLVHWILTRSMEGTFGSAVLLPDSGTLTATQR